MKKFRYLLCCLLAFCIISCYELKDDIIINQNGSGRYASQIDLSALIEMMQSFAGEEELTKGGLDRAIDTTIYFKDVIDSVADLSVVERNVLKKGKMHLVMNIREKVFKADMDYPFANYEELQFLMSGAGAGMSDVFKKVFSSPGNDSLPSNAPPDAPMEDFNAIYDVIAKDGQLSKKVNQTRLQEMLEKPEMAQLKELTNSGLEILYSATITLPRPLKNSSNSMVQVSPDKKTLTFKYNMLDILTKPASFDYSFDF